jgi:hypothetical protein
MSDPNLDVFRKFVQEHFQSDNLEQTVVDFLNHHFPSTIVRGSDSERTIIRFCSFVIRYASENTSNVQAQAFLAGIYGMLNLYGVKGTVAIIIRVQKAMKVKNATTV